MRRLPICLLAATSLLAGIASAQNVTTVLFIGNQGVTAGADADILTFLNSRYGAANVTYLDTEPNGIVKAALKGYDVVVLSSTPNSGRYRNIVHDSPAPIVNMEEAIADNNLGGEFAITSGRTKETEVDHTITITTKHPITNGFAVNSNVKICSGSAELWWSTGQQAGKAFSLAADDDTAANLFITCVEAGDFLLNSQQAKCRRVMFGMTDASFKYFTAAGKQLFGQAIDWAASECCGQSSNYGTGLAGKNGIPTLTTVGRPVYNTTINIVISNSSGSASLALIVLGMKPVSVPFFGGTLLATPTFLAYVPLPAAGLVMPAPIPDLSAICHVIKGINLNYVQVLQLDAAAVNGIAISPGLRFEMGK